MNLFAKRLKKTKAFTFAICTCGANAGNALKKLSKIYHINSSYSIIMPSNYIVGEDIEEKSVILNKLDNAKKEIDKISKEILKKKKVYNVEEGKFPTMKSNIINKGFNNFARTTNHFMLIKRNVLVVAYVLKCVQHIQ